jgi:hypothetical protein
MSLPPGRSFNSFIGPDVKSLMAKIQAAVSEGLPPEIGMQLLAQAGAGVDERYDAYRDRRQEARTALSQQAAMDSLPPDVREAYELSSLGLPASIVEANFAAGGAPGAPVGLDTESAQGIAADVQALAAMPDMDLHTARGLIMSQLRAGGATPEEEAGAYTLIGQQWSGLGMPMGGRPTTWDEYQAELNAPPVPAAPPPTLATRAAGPRPLSSMTYSGAGLGGGLFRR